ncbi:hypothetical protein GJ698_14420 [Pseudoduganella sp. FT26W]|uniref:Gel scht n=1 Tax=Duganella aquatilis TaxID=2666082 RepID=A0A844DAF4_9BURK|nr:hypothetical protein [Duganella aquatilis]MRW85276.1 hypothetical protein [Duganella aquatilis]
MKVIGLSLAAAVVWSSAVTAYAQQQEQAISAAETPPAIDTVSVTAKRFHMEPIEFTDYEYAYRISNGDVVNFSRRVLHFYVTIKGQPPVEIFPTAPDQFVTKGGAKLVFTENGDALNIDHYEAIQGASGLPVATVQETPK